MRRRCLRTFVLLLGLAGALTALAVPAATAGQFPVELGIDLGVDLQSDQ